MSNFKIGTVVFTSIAILILRFFLFSNQQSEYKDGQEISFETTLLSEPKTFGNYQTIYANLASGEKVYIKTAKYPSYHYGDTIKVSGPVKFSRSPSGTIRTRLTEQLNGSGMIKVKEENKNSKQNNLLLVNEKAEASMFFPKIEAVKNGQNSSVFSSKTEFAPIKSVLAVSSFIRQKVILFFHKTLPQVHSSLLLGIVFGIKEEMPKDFLDSLKIVGVMHVIAASGMNISMIAGFLSSIFVAFFKRQIALILTILGVTFYAVLAGLEPSIVRAAIMGILVFSSQIMGRQKMPFYILFLTAFVMLFVSPGLISDIGFQLSFMATFGLLYLKPVMENLKSVNFLTKRTIVGNDVLTTVVAQGATLPILMSNFGTYSLWSIVVNGLLLWMIPMLMILGGVGAVAGMVIEPLGKMFLYLALPFLLYFEKIVTIFAGFGGVVNISEFPWQFTLGYYLFLLSLVIFFNRKENKS